MNTDNLKKEKINAIILLSFIAGIGITFIPPVAQDPAYHAFADTRTVSGIQNFWNVISNLPFLIAGIAGIIYIFKKGKNSLMRLMLLNYFLFFSGILLTGVGSSYYHFHPDNSTLIWDRLPMSISFMSFFSIVISSFIDPKHGKYLLPILLIIGCGSVVYWYYTEMQGSGDLRLYALVQFLPMLLIPLIMLLFKPRPAITKYIWFMLLSYLLSKVCEHFDSDIYSSSVLFSGHTWKHLFASLAPLIFLAGIIITDRTSPNA
jgi:hypothetical protein